MGEEVLKKTRAPKDAAAESVGLDWLQIGESQDRLVRGGEAEANVVELEQVTMAITACSFLHARLLELYHGRCSFSGRF